jgi:hypothetical protein
MEDVLCLLWKISQLTRFSHIGRTSTSFGNDLGSRNLFLSQIKQLIEDAFYCKKWISKLLNSINSEDGGNDYARTNIGRGMYLSLKTFVRDHPIQPDNSGMQRLVIFKEFMTLLEETNLLNVVLQTSEENEVYSMDSMPRLIQLNSNLKHFSVTPSTKDDGKYVATNRRKEMIKYVTTVMGKLFPQSLEEIEVDSFSTLSTMIGEKMDQPHLLGLCYSLQMLYPDIQKILDCFETDPGTGALDCADVCDMISKAIDSSKLKRQEDYGEDDDLCMDMSMNMASIIAAECFKLSTGLTIEDAKSAGMGVLSAYENEDLYFVASKKHQQSGLKDITEKHRTQINEVLKISPPTVFSECVFINDHEDDDDDDDDGANELEDEYDAPVENIIHIEPFTIEVLWKILMNTTSSIDKYRYNMWLMSIVFVVGSGTKQKEMYLCLSRPDTTDENNLLWSSYDIGVSALGDRDFPVSLTYSEWHSLISCILSRGREKRRVQQMNMFQLGSILFY